MEQSEKNLSELVDIRDVVIDKKLTLEEEKEFIEDLKMIRSLKRNPCKGEPEKAVVIPEIFDPDLFETGPVEG